MNGITRREALKMSVSAIAFAALPPMPVAIKTPAPLPAWAVGTPGEWDWEVVRALTADDAKIEWVASHFGLDRPANCQSGCKCEEGFPCEFQEMLGGDLEAERFKEWDDKAVVAGDPTWFASGLGAYCDRCGYETTLDACGQIIEQKIVCEDCMTIADWEIVDPEHAAELRDDFE